MQARLVAARELSKPRAAASRCWGRIRRAARSEPSGRCNTEMATPNSHQSSAAQLVPIESVRAKPSCVRGRKRQVCASRGHFECGDRLFAPTQFKQIAEPAASCSNMQIRADRPTKQLGSTSCEIRRVGLESGSSRAQVEPRTRQSELQPTRFETRSRCQLEPKRAASNSRAPLEQNEPRESAALSAPPISNLECPRIPSLWLRLINDALRLAASHLDSRAASRLCK